MAKYVWVETVGMFTYALDECEDYLVLDAYLKIIESGVSAQVKTIKIFEYYHFQEGGMLNDNILMQLNGFLMRMDLPTLFFVNGHTTAYAHMRGQEKTARRASMLAYLRSLTKAHRTDFIAKKQFEASVLLGFATLKEGDVQITAEGSGFAEADILTRKILFRQAALKYIVILQQIDSILHAKTDHSISQEFFYDILDEHFSQDEVERQFETAMNWGRYAEIFDFDRESHRLVLAEPVGEPHPPTTTPVQL